MEDVAADRKFLHDLATPIAIAKAAIKKVQAEVSVPNPQDIKIDLIKDRLDKALVSLEKIELMHSDFRMQIESKLK
jgi:hypothetical protein